VRSVEAGDFFFVVDMSTGCTLPWLRVKQEISGVSEDTLAYFLIDEKYLKDYSWFMGDHSMDHEVPLLANLPCGALCRLLGGAVVRARPDVLIGEPWNGDYCVRPHHTVAWPSGVPRDQLQPLTLDKPRAYLDARSAR
jgi:hypothetical protein